MRHVLIADDHEVTRRGIREIVRDAFEGVEILEAADAGAVLRLLPERAWDLILLDLMMPGPNILDVLTRVRQELPTIPVLVLTAATEIEFVLRTMKAGANGFIHKHRASDDLVTAIRQLQQGGTYLHPETASAVAMTLQAAPPERPHERLSSRELEIFRLLALGRAIKEVAGELNLSDKTVATYLSRIREKTGLNTHVEIARYALKNGLVD